MHRREHSLGALVPIRACVPILKASFQSCTRWLPFNLLHILAVPHVMYRRREATVCRQNEMLHDGTSPVWYVYSLTEIPRCKAGKVHGVVQHLRTCVECNTVFYGAVVLRVVLQQLAVHINRESSSEEANERKHRTVIPVALMLCYYLGGEVKGINIAVVGI